MGGTTGDPSNSGRAVTSPGPSGVRAGRELRQEPGAFPDKAAWVGGQWGERLDLRVLPASVSCSFSKGLSPGGAGG